MIDHSHPAVESLAREVLDDERAWAALDPGHHPESQAAVYRLANAAPTLARAAIDLTDKVERVEALAETWEEAARLVEARGGDAETVRDLLQDIRDALNGENA